MTLPGRGAVAPWVVWIVACTMAWTAGGAPEAVAQAPAYAATVEGVVTGVFNGVRTPLPSAMVTYRGGGGTAAGTTDGEGRFSLRTPPGGGRISVDHVGFTPLSLELLLVEGRTLRLELEVEARPLELAPLAVLVLRPHPLATPPLGTRSQLAELRVRSMEAGVGLGESGLLGWVRDLPGGDEPDRRDFLLVRGGGRDLRLVLLDGAPLYAPFHLGGVLPSFPGEILEGAELHVGGAPSRFDGGLAYILDLQTREPRPEVFRFSGQADGLSARGGVEAPLPGGGALLVGGRGIHGVQPRILWGSGSPFGYREGILRSGIPLAGERELRFTFFGNRESVDLDLPNRDEAMAHWGNRVGALGYRQPLGQGHLQATLSSTTYRMGLPVGQGVNVQLEGSSRRNRMAMDVEQTWRMGTVRGGVGGEELRLRFQGDPLAGGAPPPPHPSQAEVTGRSVGGYVEVEHPLDPEFDLRAGFRVDHFRLPQGRDGRLPTSELRVAPRAALRWQMAPDAALTLAAGRYHQFTGDAGAPVDLALAPFMGSGDGSPRAGGVEGAPPLPVASATHLVLSLDQRLPRELRLILEGFTKRFQNLPGAQGFQTEASGVDVRALREAPGVSGWLGYSLTWYWSRDGESRQEDFAGRHILSGGVAGPIGNAAVLGLEVSYGTGLPYTAIPTQWDGTGSSGVPRLRTLSGTPAGMDAARNGDFPFPTGLERSFLRVDAELSGRLHREWRGRTMAFRPYLRLINALDRRDGIFHYFEPWRDPQARSVAHQPILPLMGLEWNF